MGMICPTNFFCMNETTFYLILAIILVISVSMYNKYNTSHHQKLHVIKNIIKVPQQQFEIQSPKQSIAHQRITDPLMAPEQSFPHRNPTRFVDVRTISEKPTVHIHNKREVNIPTRGEAPSYSQVGTLTSQDSAGDPIVLPLYGRPLYRGARQWLYYTSTDKFPSIKMPVTFKNKDCQSDQGCEEINSSNQVNVPAYKDRSFEAQIYRMDTLRYIPEI